MRRLVPSLCALLFWLSAGGPALAGFSVCNQTNLATRVALGWFNGKAWTAQGWWSVAPHACRALLTGPLDARYYYLYASDGKAGLWDGHTMFCTAPKSSFRAEGRANCAGRGLDRRGFFQVDTGRASDWTQTLSN